MRKYSLVAAAVAAALGSTASFADTTLVVAGSSAFRDAFANELSTSPTICATGTFQQFVAVAGAAPGQLASPDFPRLQVHRRQRRVRSWRADRLLPLRRRLRDRPDRQPHAGSERPAPQPVESECFAPDRERDRSAASLRHPDGCRAETAGTARNSGRRADRVPEQQLAWSVHCHPVRSALQGQAGTVPATKSIIGQVFAPIVSKTWASGGGNSGFFSATGLNNTEGLTSAEIATIASGAVTDWGKIPSAVAQGAPAGTPIVVCRRDAGSGTQVLTSEIFLGYNCNTGGGVGYANATGTGPNNPTPGVSAVLINYSTTDVRNCVQNNPGSIGFVALQTAAAYVGSSATQITVDGVVPSAINAASGAYKYYGEAYVVRDSTLTGGAATLANAILNDLANRNNVPTNANAPSLVAVPSSVNTAVVSPPVLGPGGTPPIAVGTTNGNSCAPFTINKL